MRSILRAAAPGSLDLTRRTLLLGGAGGLLAACTPIGQPLEPEPEVITDPALAYAAVKDGDFDLPAISPKILKPEFMRAVVDYQTDQKPGTIVVDPAARHLYFVLRNGRAIRYGVGVGRQGFAWNGGAVIRFKAVWPKWTPPSEMIERQPELEKYRKGMPGGPKNPLGARALYLYQGMQDTLYRIHGTNDPRSIGHNVSSGCIRMINQDVIDLYGRTPLGTKVVVLGDAQPTGS